MVIIKIVTILIKCNPVINDVTGERKNWRMYSFPLRLLRSSDECSVPYGIRVRGVCLERGKG